MRAIRRARYWDRGALRQLADFGTARLLVHKAETMTGTPLYMAPEVLLGKAYDLSGDVYSLGCTLFELCTLDVPHGQAGDIGELILLVRCMARNSGIEQPSWWVS